MQKQNRWIIFALALIVLAIGGITTIAIAAPTLPWEFSSADPDYVAQDTQTEGYADREPQPDEDGYTGPIPEQQLYIPESSGGSETSGQPDWDRYHIEPQPDDNLEGESVTQAEPQWSTLFYYEHVAGSALRPRDSSVEWDTDGSGGCLYNNGGDPYIMYNTHLDIPDGTRIDYLRLYFYDTNASDSIAWITQYDDKGGIVDLTYVFSSGDTGYGTTLSPEILQVYDTTNYSYVLNWRPLVGGGSMQLCGLRVAYRLPD